ncbi:Protein of unknown function [Lactobacillus helveticus CIRM-BIA 101]|nr:Protein of unknown function [Lactobacillus helveticus CIRM-BIA 101]
MGEKKQVKLVIN